MAASVEDVLQRVYTENLRGVKLKKEQEKAVLTLIEKKDVFAILPTVFGKSLIYQSYCVAKNAIDSVMPAVIVVVPLRSIAPNCPSISKNFKLWLLVKFEFYMRRLKKCLMIGSLTF